MNYKNTLAAMPAILLLTACGGGGSEHSVDVIVDGAAGKTVYFDKFVNNRPVHLDSAVLDGSGHATINIPALSMDFYRLSLSPQDNFLVAIDSTQHLSVKMSANKFDQPTSIEGSPTTARLQEYYDRARAFETESDSLRTYLQTNNQDVAAIQRYNQLNKEYYDYSKNFVQDAPGSPAALPALNKLNRQTEIDLAVKTRDALAATMGESEFFLAFRDEINRMEKQLAAQKIQQQQQAKLSNLVAIGSEAPDFTQTSPDGKQISLSDYRGKVVLIDFWASWCKPCRIENPHVVKAYNKYKNKGFEILGVSLDRQKERWVQAIQQDGLTWPHVSDLQFWNNAAAQAYGVSSIPHTVLVDRDGKVIAKKLRGAALDKKLAEILG